MKQVANNLMDYTLNIEICSDWNLTPKKKQAWLSLSNSHYNPNVFLTIDWLKLWWEVYATEKDELHLVYIWQEQCIIAIYPLYIQDRKVARFIGTGESEADEVCSEYLDVLVNKNELTPIYDVVGKLHEQLLAKKLSLIFNDILENSHILKIVRRFNTHAITMLESTGARYFVQLPNTYQEFEKSCSKNFISQAKRKMRSFKRLNSEVMQVKNSDDLELVFNELVKLHNSSWAGKGKLGAFESNKFRHFHLQFAQIMLSNDCLSMKVLKIDNIIVGVIYNFSYKGTKAFYQMGIDSTIKHNVSVGTLLHLLEIESSIHNGHCIYDFMKGDNVQSYKSAYTKNKTPMFNVAVVKKDFSGFYIYSIWQIKQLISKYKK